MEKVVTIKTTRIKRTIRKQWLLIDRLLAAGVQVTVSR